MIKIPAPCMVMNSHNTIYPRFRHTNTWEVGEHVTAQGLLGWAAAVLAGFKKDYPSRRATLVMNCHGFYRIGSDRKGHGGYGLAMGRGVRSGDVVQFEKIQPYVDDIIIVACGAAAGGDGCSSDARVLDLASIARAAKATVTAGTGAQVWEGNYSAAYLPIGYIDDFEGTVLTYDAEGNLISSSDTGQAMSVAR